MWNCSSVCCSGDDRNKETVTADPTYGDKSVLDGIDASLAAVDSEPFSAQQRAQAKAGGASSEDAEPSFSQEETQDKKLEVVPAAPINLQVNCSPESKLGVTMDMSDEDLCIVSVVKPEGLVQAWNMSCAKGQDIQVFHRLTRVNGVKAKTKEMVKMILSLMSSGGFLHMEFTPPSPFVAKINRNNGFWSLGLESYMAKRQYLAIKGFQDQGALLDWNRTANDHERIGILSRIIALNGTPLSGEEILERMANLDDMELTVLNWH
eukprot:TRINITY_DN78753_c0_g1_i1.p1 TRINITY_DN78753_c0_g1~~TRINITY_DN78753_c0_g1_i1.p1  ORF type:complete len:281 (-),score=59.35 TRINITY_DN78753_c0_g1_i1:89-880(-)